MRLRAAAERIDAGPRIEHRTSSFLISRCCESSGPTVRETHPNDKIPDVRDGLTRQERVVLYVLHEAQKERGDRNVPTAMLWGRVCEHFYISPEDLSAMLARLGARK
jgi:hypothetical protein